MTKSATDVMQEILFSAVADALEGLKSASRGVPNTLLRDIGSVHANATFADLPKELQAAITASVRAAFNRLNKEGYSIAPLNAPPPRRPPRGGPLGGPKAPDTYSTRTTLTGSLAGKVSLRPSSRRSL